MVNHLTLADATNLPGGLQYVPARQAVRIYFSLRFVRVGSDHRRSVSDRLERCGGAETGGLRLAGFGSDGYV
jgi:hypothetical protein